MKKEQKLVYSNSQTSFSIQVREALEEGWKVIPGTQMCCTSAWDATDNAYYATFMERIASPEEKDDAA